MNDLYQVNLADVFIGSLVKDGTLVPVEDAMSRAEWEATINIEDREPIEWCNINGIPGFACPDHQRHIDRDREHDAGRRGLVYVIGAENFNAGIGGTA